MANNPTGNTFVRLGRDLLQSEAWQHLSPPACKLYIAIRQRHNGRNNGRIPYSVAEARTLLGCGATQAVRFFKELQDKGLIVKIKNSVFDVSGRDPRAKAPEFASGSGEAREWAITAEKVGSEEPTNNFKEWKFDKD